MDRIEVSNILGCISIFMAGVTIGLYYSLKKRQEIDKIITEIN